MIKQDGVARYREVSWRNSNKGGNAGKALVPIGDEGFLFFYEQFFGEFSDKETIKMLKKPTLFMPGPTNVPERVLQAMDRPVINHRGPAYEGMFRKVSTEMQGIFQTQEPVLIYPAAGTGMMEAAIVNVLSPGDTVLVVSIGVFGDRIADIATRFGLKVEKLAVEWGCAAEPQVLKERLEQDVNREIKAVFITHNETSTGITNPLQQLAAAAAFHPALVIVDAVSSLGAIELKMDEWGLDVVFTGAQKALMLPPGLGFMALSSKAMAAYETSTLPKYYWDVALLKKSLAKWQNPYTPPVSLLFGLQESLTMIAEEGLYAIFRRHEILARAVRAGVTALGLELFAQGAGASNVVTAVKAPEGIGGKAIQSHMREFFGITLAGGQKQLENKIFRIGHLGYVAPTDVLLVIAALEMTLTALKVPCSLGEGVKAAQLSLLADGLLVMDH
ncbi:MAG: alanine--glyoxylate aminotransferase family protein [Sporomusaceae bacterium]|nr:alanine--glyoxylate aminotransferase family protein [Sporomusaceae bacterium]